LVGFFCKNFFCSGKMFFFLKSRVLFLGGKFGKNVKRGGGGNIV